MVKKYINTAIDMPLNLEKDLKSALGNGHQKGCCLCVIVKWWKEGYLESDGKL